MKSEVDSFFKENVGDVGVDEVLWAQNSEILNFKTNNIIVINQNAPGLPTPIIPVFGKWALRSHENPMLKPPLFKGTKNQLDSMESSSTSAAASASGGFGGFSAGGSASSSKQSGSSAGSATLTSDKNQTKEAELNEEITKKTKKTEKMVGEMAIKVIRYEMYLREVKPNYIDDEFLNCFMNLPQSLFSPKSPQKFQSFIQTYGTHYVKAAKFGGQFKVIKTRKITSTADIKDFRKEIQKEMNNIVGNTAMQNRASQVEKTQATSVEGSAAAGTQSVSASASVGFVLAPILKIEGYCLFMCVEKKLSPMV